MHVAQQATRTTHSQPPRCPSACPLACRAPAPDSCTSACRESSHPPCPLRSVSESSEDPRRPRQRPSPNQNPTPLLGLAALPSRSLASGLDESPVFRALLPELPRFAHRSGEPPPSREDLP